MGGHSEGDWRLSRGDTNVSQSWAEDSHRY